MHGKVQAQPDFLTVVNLNAAVPVQRPLCVIKTHVVRVVFLALNCLFSSSQLSPLNAAESPITDGDYYNRNRLHSSLGYLSHWALNQN